ncbi:MAG TPA: type II toxin-antitoxin system RelE/ParE family toxin, partial [Candidatus Norongarragalinales archaeon]|nr:type II toxin-antitoxin system RelE/ParE family toxin [Candidatus Norongarragalinales archaeon]
MVSSIILITLAEFSLFFSKEFEQAYGKLDKSVKRLVEKRLKKIAENPFLGKPLHGEPNSYSERLLQYRIIYEVQGKK